ncbi:MAG: bifunctional (p)ppGpp synthetase/guanosine-3',5'-bis(diphosphate) 3'-pyrophosphohydrolase [Lachnospiraceae bacterium]|nr:bifunctional (p)ppGpp synthetase/guanosine-3',5'-bis(diphosphate) 3'-pyrophosphohydrolase [Lachnospiraceae bacterium]
MDYEALLKKAEEIATKAHKGQFDRCGVEYINHPRTVASYVDNPKEKIIAWLHDTIEDTDITESDLRPIFGDEITDTVLILTRHPDEDYFDYIRRVMENPTAIKVKLADLTHNMQPDRIKHPSDMDNERREKYQKAYKMLIDKLNN